MPDESRNGEVDSAEITQESSNKSKPQENSLVADAAQWRHHLAHTSSRREVIKNALKLTGAAALGASLGVASQDQLASYVSMPDVTLPDRGSSNKDSLASQMEAPQTAELVLGKETVLGTRDGWTYSFDLDDLTSAMSKNGLTFLTLDAQYPGAITDQIPSFTIDQVQKDPNAVITTTDSATFDNAEGPTKVRLHLLPINSHGEVDIEVNTSKGRLVEPLRVDLESQPYELREGQTQRVFSESPNDSSRLIPEAELHSLQNIADNFTGLGLDAKIFIAEKAHDEKISLPNQGLALGEGVVLRKSDFVSEALASKQYGKMKAYHKLARSAMEKLTDRSVHSQDTIEQILNQLEILRENKTLYEGSLSGREASRNVEARDEGKNILDITEGFDRLDLGVSYLKDGESTSERTASLSDANELLASMMGLINFGDIMDFEVNFKNLHETQRGYVANILEHGLSIIQKAAMDSGSSLEKILPNAESYKKIVQGYAS